MLALASTLLTLIVLVTLAACCQRTRLKRTEQALGESQQRFEALANGAAIGVWDWNFASNELHISPGLKAKLGFGDSEITTSPDDWGSRVHPQDLPAAAARVKACLDGETDIYEIEHRMLHKDGSVRWFLSRGSAIKRADGTLHRLIGTKVDITEAKRAEEVIRESEAALRASNDEIRRLAGSLISAQDAERARIARDLHDDISQQLAALGIALSGFKRQLGTLADAYEHEWSALHRRIDGLADSVRGLSHGLHPDALRHGGLTAALAAYCDGISAARGIHLTFTAGGDLDSLDSETALCFYRITQEALHNVVKHSGAQRSQVLLMRGSDSIELSVIDDGGGFDVVEARKSGSGLGLISISERVRLAGGTLTVMTERHRGTQLHVRLPADAPAPAQPASPAGPYMTA